MGLEKLNSRPLFPKEALLGSFPCCNLPDNGVRNEFHAERFPLLSKNGYSA